MDIFCRCQRHVVAFAPLLGWSAPYFCYWFGLWDSLCAIGLLDKRDSLLIAQHFRTLLDVFPYQMPDLPAPDILCHSNLNRIIPFLDPCYVFLSKCFPISDRGRESDSMKPCSANSLKCFQIYTYSWGGVA